VYAGGSVFSTLIYSLINLGRLLSIRQGNFGLLVQVTGRKFECEKGWTALLYMRNYPRPQLSLQRNYKFSLVGLCNEFLDADEIVYSTMEKKTRFDNLIFQRVLSRRPRKVPELTRAIYDCCCLLCR
jgi:hypothetical protein